MKINKQKKIFPINVGPFLNIYLVPETITLIKEKDTKLREKLSDILDIDLMDEYQYALKNSILYKEHKLYNALQLDNIVLFGDEGNFLSSILQKEEEISKYINIGVEEFYTKLFNHHTQTNPDISFFVYLSAS